MTTNTQTTNEALLARRKAVLPTGLGIAFPIFAERAKNSEIWDVEGKRYIDFIGGISVLNTGHSHPKITQRVHEQVDKFTHTAAQIVSYESYVDLAEKLCEKAPISGPTKALFLTTGAEAVENCIKIARAKTRRPGIISFVGGWHGRTMMCMSLTGKVLPYKKNFGPMPGPVFHALFPAEELNITEAQALHSLDMIFQADIDPSEVAAMIIEPIQGEGGFHQVTPSFAKALREICDEHGIVLIFDEVQCGFARTGTLFAGEQLGVEPDLMTTAKSLAGGYPVSAVIGRADIMDAPQVGGLGGTYSGSPIALAAALAVIEVIEEENLLERSVVIGDTIAEFLKGLNLSSIGNIRYKGAMLAFDLVDSEGKPDAAATANLKQKSFEQGLLLASCGMYGNAIRVMVPLTVEDEILQEGLDIIGGILTA
ncbi:MULTISPECIES: 4-aminobutyrate--2-oxoglutarate transaminase [Psychrobacter]|jgi:4-aminobutyrate aminotransferase/(S)-3-amino-2-methylpropionate transaminase|uniref:4-aminobutyrate--2-oxoglutarate transaminase n=1 Tax=Psychrobacter TaxID=497 RepID=UPI0018CDFB6D|nr:MULTISPECIES: 4-aminobutyrate--2-oxoglutarate transaminase [Psychrobacter]MBH0064352.1 4-aminobutyrate--2-oxoglutarate transaminase [Psychrobacter sp. SZ93C1]